MTNISWSSDFALYLPPIHVRSIAGLPKFGQFLNDQPVQWSEGGEVKSDFQLRDRVIYKHRYVVESSAIFQSCIG